jgi:hypothetical protein
VLYAPVKTRKQHAGALAKVSSQLKVQISTGCILGAKIVAKRRHGYNIVVVFVKVCSLDGCPFKDFLDNSFNKLVHADSKEVETSPQSNGEWQ